MFIYLYKDILVFCKCNFICIIVIVPLIGMGSTEVFISTSKLKCWVPLLLAAYHVFLQRYQQLKQEWEMKSEEAELLKMKLQQNAYHKQEEELLALKKTIGETNMFLIL